MSVGADRKSGAGRSRRSDDNQTRIYLLTRKAGTVEIAPSETVGLWTVLGLVRACRTRQSQRRNCAWLMDSRLLLGNGGVDGTRTRGLRRDRPAF